MAHHPRNKSDGGAQMTSEESDILFANSVRLIELDDESKRTSFCKQLLSHMTAKSQLDAFIYMTSELRRRTTGDLVSTAWHQVGILYTDHPELVDDINNTFYVALGDLTLKAWETRQAELVQRQGRLAGEITPHFIRALLSARQRGSNESTTVPTMDAPNSGSGSMAPIQPGFDAQGQMWASSAIISEPIMPTAFAEDELGWAYWNELLQIQDNAYGF